MPDREASPDSAPAAPGAPCRHCGTPCPPGADDGFCCAGCGFVYSLIYEQGLDQYYAIKGRVKTGPVGDRVFEPRDLAWLEARTGKAEGRARESGEPLATAEFSLAGISCIGCVWLVERLFLRSQGAARAEVDATDGSVRLSWRVGACDLAAFADELRGFGYLLDEPGAAGAGRAKGDGPGSEIGLCGAFAMNAMAFTAPRYFDMPETFAFAGVFELVAMASATLALLVGGSYFARRAWAGLRQGVLSVDLPVTLGIGAAYAGSVVGWLAGHEDLLYFDFVAVFILLMLLGRHVQARALARNRARAGRRDSIPRAVETPGGEVLLDELEIGAAYSARPGQAVPVASMVVANPGTVSLGWIDGEPEPRPVGPGMRVPAGALNIGRERLELVADEPWADSLLRRLAGDNRTGPQRNPAFERVLKLYTLVVVVLGLLGAAAWWSGSRDFPKSLQVMVSLYVVSCPCALGVAVPLVDEMARARLERAGVFLRNTGFWSRLRRVRDVVFDKTGTLTLELPELQNPGAVGGLEPDAHRALSTLVSGSLHPLSRSLSAALGAAGQRAATAEAARRKAGGSQPVDEVPGNGMEWRDPGGSVWRLGRPDWASDDGAGGAARTDGDCLLTRDGVGVAGFTFTESLRPGTRDGLGGLRSRGLAFHVFSGDRQDKVDAVAADLAIPPGQARGGLTPDDKAERVRGLGPERVLFIGDGANDSLAFDEASCRGTPVVDRGVLEQKADFYFMGRGLGFLSELFATGDRRAAAIRAVATLAVLYNLGAATACLAGVMKPLIAAVLMPLSSVATIGLGSLVFTRKAPPPGAAAADARARGGEPDPTCYGTPSPNSDQENTDGSRHRPGTEDLRPAQPGRALPGL